MFTALSLAVCMLFGLVFFLIYMIMYGDHTAAVWSAFFLGGAAVTIFYAIFHSLDWINDWMAGRQAQQMSQQALEDMRLAFRAQAEQGRSLNSMFGAMNKAQGTIPPHVGYQDEMFSDFDDTPLPD